MTPQQTVKLIKILSEKRAELRFSTNEVARRAHLDTVAVWRIEQGMVAKPRAETLIAIGRALGINPIELFTTVGWITADDLPDLSTYLSAKFKQLSGTAIEDIAQYVDNTVHAHGRSGRTGHHGSTTYHCPQKTNHCPHCPCAPKEC